MASQKVKQSFSTRKRFFYGYTVVVAAFLILIVVFGVHYAFGVFLKPVLNEFGWTRAITSGAISLCWIVQGLLGIVMGGLNDKLGPRIILTLCGFLLGLGYLLMSQVSVIWQLYLFYGVFVGAGLGGVFVPLTSTAARWFVARRGMMTGIAAAGTGIGTLIMPPVANWLISLYNWHVSYIILGSIVLVVVVLAAQFLRRNPAQMGQRPYGENEEVEQGLKTEIEEFSLREATYTKQFWLAFAMFYCFGFCSYAIMVHIVPHATDLGISAASAAGILATIGAVSIVGKVVMGIAADRIGNRQVFLISFILMSASLFWLTAVTELWMLCVFAIVFGFAYGSSITVQSPLVAELFGTRSHGMIFGVISNGLTLGATIGPFLTGYIFDVSGSYRLAFLLYASISIAGIVFTMLLKPIRGKHRQNKVSL